MHTLLPWNRSCRLATRHWRTTLLGYPRLARFIPPTRTITSSIHMGNVADKLQIGMVPGFRFCGKFWGLIKKTSGGIQCIFGSQTFVPTNWMCEKQTAVSHGSTESEVISSDGGLRTDGITTLICGKWLLKFYLHSSPHHTLHTEGTIERHTL